jgi:hypothetical protein
MGTICAHPTEKDECNETVDTTKKNCVQLQGTLGGTTYVELVLGTWALKKDTTASRRPRVCW